MLAEQYIADQPLARLVDLKVKVAVPAEALDLSSKVARAIDFKPSNRAPLPYSALQPIKDKVREVRAPEALIRLTERMSSHPEFAVKIVDALMYLQDNLPANEYELTPMGYRKVVAPSTTQDMQFLWKARIVENPFYILDLFAKQMLTTHDVTCMRTVYPDLYEAIAMEFITQIGVEYAADSAIPRPLRLMLAIFFGLPTITLQQLLAYADTGETASQENSSQSPELAALEEGNK